MAPASWPSPTDPRGTVRVGQARVRVPGAPGAGAAPPSAWLWQQRIESALRCARVGSGQRLVLVRKLQVRAGSASAPGWDRVVEAAAQDLLERARHGCSAGAEQSPAVWFDNWDEAVAAWLDVMLRWPGPGGSARAWFWPRIARLAGLDGLDGVAAWPALSDNAATPQAQAMALQQAQAMWRRWQADPVSQRACRAWIAQRPAWHEWLQTAGTGEPLAQASVLATSASPPAPAAWSAGHGQDLPSATARVGPPLAVAGPTPQAAMDWKASRGLAAFPAAGPLPAGHDTAHAVPAQALAAVAALPAERDARPHRTAQVLGAAQSFSTAPDPRPPAPPPAGSAPSHLPGPAAQTGAATATDWPSGGVPGVGAASAAGWQATQLGGWPLTLNALLRLGFADALDHLAPTLDPVGRWLAASAPWLAVWSRLGEVTRCHWLADPMAPVLPAFDAVDAGQGGALLALWRAQPPAVHQLGRWAWRQLQRAAPGQGWPGPRALLCRPAWLQLSATHLDVLFSLDQADLAVRRLGLDADPGWVPWLGRIVQLHFEPTDPPSPWSPP